MVSYGDLYYKLGEDYIRISIDEQNVPRKFGLLKTSDSKRFAGYTMINRDLDLVIEALKESKKEAHAPIIQQSLFSFSVVTYAKCFISNESGRSSLNVDDIFKNASDLFKDDHARIMLLRNDYVAHAGGEFDQCLVIGTIIQNRNFIIGIDVNSQLKYVVSMPPKIEDFISLCSFVKEKVKIKIEKALKKIFDYCNSPEVKQMQIITPDNNNLYRFMEVEDKSSVGYKRYDFFPL